MVKLNISDRVLTYIYFTLLLITIFIIIWWLLNKYNCNTNINNYADANANANVNNIIVNERNNYVKRGQLENSTVPTINEGFTALQPPSNVVLTIIDENTINVKFNYAVGSEIPNKFVAVLAKYVNQNGVLNHVGDAQFIISDETVSDGTTNMCTLLDNQMSCQHTFAGINSRDQHGNPYLFKLGIAAVSNGDFSPFATPNNIGVGNIFFVTTKSASYINNIVNAANTVTSNPSQLSDIINGNGSNNMLGGSSGSGGMSTADGQYSMIASQLGGYPNNLVMDQQVANANLLSDLVNKSFSNGVINVKVSSNL